MGGSDEAWDDSNKDEDGEDGEDGSDGKCNGDGDGDNYKQKTHAAKS